MERKATSSITLIIFALLTTFFNQVLIVPYIYKLNFKFAFFVMLIVYFLQASLLILFKYLYERIRLNGLLFMKIKSEKIYKIYWIIYLIISLILLFFLIYFFFSFIDNYFYVNAKYNFIVPLLFVVAAYGLAKSFYSILYIGAFTFIILSIQFIVFFFAPKTIDISVFLPIDFTNNSNNIYLLYLSFSILLFPILSLPLADISSTTYTYKEIIITSSILFISNAYFLFMQMRQLGSLLTYIDHPFYIIFDALDLGYYSEHLYIVPVTLCLITTFIFILYLLHSIKHITFTKNKYILLLFSLLLLISFMLFKKIHIFTSIINLLLILLPFTLFILLIVSLIIFRERKRKNEEDIRYY